MSNVDRPMWEMMRDAYGSSYGTRQEGYAAEIRVIAREMGTRFPDRDSDLALSAVYAWLCDEADRAEAWE